MQNQNKDIYAGNNHEINEIGLSSSGLKNCLFTGNDFEIQIVMKKDNNEINNNNFKNKGKKEIRKRIKCNKMIASFISPNISRSLISDISQSIFVIEIEIERGKENKGDKEGNEGNDRKEKMIEKCLEIIESLIEGEAIPILKERKEDTLELIMNVSKQLGNEELYKKIIEIIEEDIKLAKNLNNRKEEMEKIIDLISKDERYGFFQMTEIKNKNLREIARNFNDCVEECFERLSIEDLKTIVGDENLKIESEDELFDKILKYQKTLKTSMKKKEDNEQEKEKENKDKFKNRSTNDRYEEMNDLLEYIHFENLKLKNLEKYFKRMKFEQINLVIWNKIIEGYLNLKKEIDKKPERTFDKQNSIEIAFNEGKEFDGIFEYLIRTNEGNPHVKGDNQHYRIEPLLWNLS